MSLEAHENAYWFGEPRCTPAGLSVTVGSRRRHAVPCRRRFREETIVSIEVVDVTGGEVLAAGPMTIRVIEDGSHTEHRLGIVEVTIPPRVDGPPQHVHRQHDETFFVVSGEPTFTSAGEIVAARPGMLITAPPGTSHTFANPGDVPVVMLCTITPDLYIEYFRELAALPRGALDPRAVAKIMSRYATEVVPPAG
jgi:mannose-6-phosphate isomerase-like protein (cupin superfamily)